MPTWPMTTSGDKSAMSPKGVKSTAEAWLTLAVAQAAEEEEEETEEDECFKGDEVEEEEVD